MAVAPVPAPANSSSTSGANASSSSNVPTSVVHFSNYNDEGYQFTLATGRRYWLRW